MPSPSAPSCWVKASNVSDGLEVCREKAGVDRARPAAKYIFYPIDGNERHHADFPGIDYWLSEARDAINTLGGLCDPGHGIFITNTTKNEGEMTIQERSTPRFLRLVREKIIRETREKRPLIITLTAHHCP